MQTAASPNIFFWPPAAILNPHQTLGTVEAQPNVNLLAAVSALGASWFLIGNSKLSDHCSRWSFWAFFFFPECNLIKRRSQEDGNQSASSWLYCKLNIDIDKNKSRNNSSSPVMYLLFTVKPWTPQCRKVKQRKGSARRGGGHLHECVCGCAFSGHRFCWTLCHSRDTGRDAHLGNKSQE